MKNPKSELNKHVKNRYKLSPKTSNQADYIRTIAENDVTICAGPAGSGKTTICVGLACEHLLAGKVEKIIVTRPVVESGGGLGYLPGSFQDKIHPYLVPIMDEMVKYLSPSGIDYLKKNDILEVCPLEYMRGRNFHNSFIILDEAQNATLDQIKMLITRLGAKSKVVVNGDMGQTDLSHRDRGGLETCISCLNGLHGVGISELTDDDVVRNKIISSILCRLEDAENSI